MAKDRVSEGMENPDLCKHHACATVIGAKPALRRWRKLRPACRDGAPLPRRRLRRVFERLLLAGVAAFGLRGRGFSIDQPIARNASKPRCGASDASPSWAAIQRATLPLRAGHKAMYACYRDDRPPVIILDAPHSLYVCPIDLRDDGFEAFDFLEIPSSPARRFAAATSV